ncbi:MAG: substrate-binding domain-containing protein, partial [Acetobacteraceae bacterium]|nr:substrate-binding domain-containing protein [Acetobacteraceae bacterium]
MSSKLHKSVAALSHRASIRRVPGAARSGSTAAERDQVNRRSFLLASGAAALLPLAARAEAAQITGAGATFPAPVYAKWGEAAQAAIGIQLNYQAIGSGGGQNQIFNRTVDFGASDAPVAADRLEQHGLLQFPAVMGSVV